MKDNDLNNPPPMRCALFTCDFSYVIGYMWIRDLNMQENTRCSAQTLLNTVSGPKIFLNIRWEDTKKLCFLYSTLMAEV